MRWTLQTAALQSGETQRRRERTINIEQGQMGYAYEVVFRPYMGGAQQVCSLQYIYSYHLPLIVRACTYAPLKSRPGLIPPLPFPLNK